MFRNHFSRLWNNFWANNSQGEVARNTGVSTIIKFGSISISFAMQLVLARLMGAEEFGSYTYIWTWITTLTLFGTLGFNVATIRFVPIYRANKQWQLLRGFLNRVYLFTSVLSLLSCLLISIVIFLLYENGRIEKEISSLFILALPLLAFYALIDIQAGVLRGGSNLWLSLGSQLIVTPLLILLGTLFIAQINAYANSIQASIVILINIFSVVVAGIIQYMGIRKEFPIFSKDIYPVYNDREWIGTALSMTLTSSAQRLNSRLDVLLVGSFIGRTEVGIYAVASRLISIVSYSLEISNAASAHVLVRLHSQEKYLELQKAVRLTCQFAFLTAVPVVILLFFWADKVLVLYGKEFVGGMVVLRILLIGELVNLLTGPNGIILNLTGYHKEVAWILGLTVGLNAFVSLLLIPDLRLIGVALGDLVSQIFRNSIGVRLAWTKLNLNTTIIPVISKKILSHE